MLFPFEIEVDLISDSTPLLLQKWKMKESSCFHAFEEEEEKTSVLDITASRTNSPSSSSTTLSSSLATNTTTAASVFSGGVPEKCAGIMDDWENALSDLAATSPHNSSMIPFTGAPLEFDFGTGFDLGHHTIGGAHMNIYDPQSSSVFPNNNGGLGNMFFGPISNDLIGSVEASYTDEKPQIYNPQFFVNHHAHSPIQNPAMFLQPQQEHQNFVFSQPNLKRANHGVLDPNHLNQKVSFLDHDQLQFVPNSHLHQQQQRPASAMAISSHKLKIGGEEEMILHQQHQQSVIDQILKAVDLMEMGNSVHAQAILARLNHQLSPIGNSFQRVAYYFKESLNLLLHHVINNGNTYSNTIAPTSSLSNCSPFGLIFKIGAYKSFSEISPLVQFANFTCNQAILEALDRFERIHVIDFDIGYGGQWASLMQELALRNGGPPSLKISAFASPSTHDELELNLARENLTQFALGVNIPFQLEIMNLDLLDSMPLHVSNHEAIAVNLPIGAFSMNPMVLRFVKQLSPKIVVSLDRGCDRNDLPFAHHIRHAIHSYTNLLESIDAVHVNLDALQKIERFLIHPGIEKLVMGRHRSSEKTPPWKSLFLAAGFSPLSFSNFTESQAECLVQRTPVRGFHIEKRQSSLVLCWQQKDLISASAWRC